MKVLNYDHPGPDCEVIEVDESRLDYDTEQLPQQCWGPTGIAEFVVPARYGDELLWLGANSDDSGYTLVTDNQLPTANEGR